MGNDFCNITLIADHLLDIMFDFLTGLKQKAYFAKTINIMQQNACAGNIDKFIRLTFKLGFMRHNRVAGTGNLKRMSDFFVHISFVIRAAFDGLEIFVIFFEKKFFRFCI